MRIRNVDRDTQIGGASGAFFGLFCQTFCVGYDFASEQWGVSEQYGLWNTNAFAMVDRGPYGKLDDGLFHVVSIECKTTGITVYVDGECMLNTNRVVRQNYNFGILYPRLCNVDFACFSFKYNGSWLADHLTGEDIITTNRLVDRNTGYGTGVQNFTGNIVYSSGDAITDAENAFNALTAAEKLTVVSAPLLEQKRATYNALTRPSAAMSGSPDSSKIKANIYINLPSRADPRNYTASFGSTTAALSTMTATANGYKFSATLPAKQMGDAIAYSVTDFYGTTVKSGSVTIAGYANALSAYYPQYADFMSAMLTYGAAAQTYFGYDVAHLVSDADLGALSPVSASRFDYDTLNGILNADSSIPITYSAMNVTFLADTTLSVAFRVKDGFTDNAALSWVTSNVRLGGAAVTPSLKVSGDYHFIVISKQNIAISDVTGSLTLKIGSGNYPISAMNYFASAEATGTANLKALTRALYAYALAARSVAG